jgi:hypothetical protein
VNQRKGYHVTPQPNQRHSRNRDGPGRGPPAHIPGGIPCERGRWARAPSPDSTEGRRGWCGGGGGGVSGDDGDLEMMRSYCCCEVVRLRRDGRGVI